MITDQQRAELKRRLAELDAAVDAAMAARTGFGDWARYRHFLFDLKEWIDKEL